VIVVPDPADEQRHPAAALPFDAGQHLGDVERGLPDLHETDE
jgi:hypothetical protein